MSLFSPRSGLNILFLLLLAACSVPPPLPTATAVPTPTATPQPLRFDGERAYADVKTQVSFGPRIPGTPGHARVREWIMNEAKDAGWQVEVQTSESMGHTIYNLVAKNRDGPPQIIVGAHYDTRMYADQDSDPLHHALPVPGANDGGSGVAVLLGLARSLPKYAVPVWLVFFDAEDNGNIENWDWILGSREFVRNNLVQPRAVVIVDMIGDADLNIYREHNSNVALMDEIWATARSLGHENQFIDEYKHSMIDDHTPFIEAGIPAVDIIDFDYPYWHTLEDTPDKVSAESLQIVGETVRRWIIQQSGHP